MTHHTTIYDLPGHILTYILWLCHDEESEIICMVNKDFYNIIMKLKTYSRVSNLDCDNEIFNRMSFRYYHSAFSNKKEIYLHRYSDIYWELRIGQWDIYEGYIYMTRSNVQCRSEPLRFINSNIFKYNKIYDIWYELRIISNGVVLFTMDDSCYMGALIRNNRNVYVHITGELITFRVK